MARYTITYKCGCTEEVQLFGKMTDREYKIKRAEEDICPNCRRKAANREAEDAMKIRGLHELRGSEKQVAWAITIREGAYKALDCLRPYATTEDTKSQISQWEDFLSQKEDASWWIEHRYEMPKSFFDPYSERAALDACRDIVRAFISLTK